MAQFTARRGSLGFTVLLAGVRAAALASSATSGGSRPASAEARTRNNMVPGRCPRLPVCADLVENPETQATRLTGSPPHLGHEVRVAVGEGVPLDGQATPLYQATAPE
ncbi:MAG: hypothetical protein H0W06_10125 [Chloroflexia bacterium]|nr:hypothetical protein [Chloroflexia bacterium]